MLNPFVVVALFGAASLAVWRYRKPKLRKSMNLILTEEERTIKNDHRSRSDANCYPWLRRWVDFEQMTMGGLMVGAPGSGKTVSMKLLMKPVLNRIAAQGLDTRAVVYDSKTDMMPFFAAMLGERAAERIIVLNPLDERAKAWDMAQDISDRFQIETFAAHLIPAPESLQQNRWVNETAQTILADVMIALDIIAKGKWRLKDLVMICRSERLMRFVLDLTPATRLTISEHFHSENTAFQSIKSTLARYMRQYESIALAWERCFPSPGNNDRSKLFTTKDWIQESRLLVLGNNHRAREATRQINTLILSQLQSHVLDVDVSDPDNANKQSWFILDEFRELGKIENFNDFLVTCRGKNAPVVIGFQDISGVDALYGEHHAREILACFNNLALFHINNSNPRTQKWASDTLGQAWDRDTSVNRGSAQSPNGFQSSEGSTTSMKLFTIMQPAQFSLELPTVKMQGKLHSVTVIAGETAKGPIPANQLFKNEEHIYYINEEKQPYLQNPDAYVRAPFQPLDLTGLDEALVWRGDDFDRLAIEGLHTVYNQLLEKREAQSQNSQAAKTAAMHHVEDDTINA